MNHKTKKRLTEIVLISSSIYLYGSFIAGKAYSDCTRNIESNNIRIEYFESQDNHTAALPFIQFNNELNKNVNLIKHSPLYYPFGLTYDLLYPK